ncbi:MAG: orotate phosphoribosyltransferase [Thermosynechococcaceae cyanobacterium]
MAPPPSSQIASAPLSDLKPLLLNLLCTKAYKVGDFTLSSGQKSTYYINGKWVTLDPVGALLIGRLMLDALPPGTQGVAGLTLGADPLVSAISVVSAYEGCPIPGLIVRKEAKGHGTQAYIEGPPLPVDSLVAVVEDVVTTGQSALKAVDRLRTAGYQVNHILTLVDREQGGAQTYGEMGLQFDALFTIRDLQQQWQRLQESSGSETNAT